MQTNHQPINTAAHGLRPEAKPIQMQMSGPFMQAAAKANLVKLLAVLKRVFLRLGFDGFRCERSGNGFRLRLCGHNLNTGRYCDHHSIFIGRMDIAADFSVRIEDRGAYYALSIRLAKEASGEAA